MGDMRGEGNPGAGLETTASASATGGSELPPGM